jgi:hypothetical protein
MLPNIFPLVVIAALLVITGRSLDPATVIVFNVCLGLAVDDTVHVLSALARNRREGISIATAVRRAVAETGNPIVIGGLVLTVGFAAVIASSVPSLAGFGKLACAAVAAASRQRADDTDRLRGISLGESLRCGRKHQAEGGEVQHGKADTHGQGSARCSRNRCRWSRNIRSVSMHSAKPACRSAMVDDITS